MNISCDHLPKVELHCHLLGVIGPSLLNKLAVSQPALIDPIKLSEIYPILGLDGFNKWLGITMPYQKASLDELSEILRLHIEDLILQNVVYTELMISPMMFSTETDQLLKSFEYFKKKVVQWERNLIQVEFLMVIPRMLPEEKLKRDVNNYIELFKAGLIVGVALVGLETNESIERFKPYLSRLKDKGLGIEIHAGEHSGSHSVWEALSFGLADRIGHGISAFSDKWLIEHLLVDKIHVEFCVTSNLSTGSVKTLAQHPIVQAKELGMNFSINTDDPGIFNCSLNSEFQLLVDSFGFNNLDFDKIYNQSLVARFASDLRYIK